MPTAAQLSLASGAVKRAYGSDAIPSAVALHSDMFKEFLKQRIPYSGGGEPAATTAASWTPTVTLFVSLRNNRAIGARAMMGDIPRGSQPLIMQPQATLSYLYGGIMLTGQQVELVDTNKNAAANVILITKDNLAEGLASDAERQMCSATLGKVDDLDATRILTTDRYIQEGDVIDTYDGATIHGNSLSVTLVDFDTAPEGKCWVTLSAVTSIVVGDLIYREDAKGYEVTNFDSIISSSADGNASYLGISGATYSYWNSYTKAWNAEFDMKGCIIDPVWAVWKRYRGVIDTLWGNEKIQTAFAMKSLNNLTGGLQRIIGGKLEPVTSIDAGFGDGLVFTHPVKGQKIVFKASTLIPDGNLYGMEKATWGIAAYKEPHWMPGWYGEGSIFTQAFNYATGSKQDAYEAAQKFYWVPVCKVRSHQYKFTGITTP